MRATILACSLAVTVSSFGATGCIIVDDDDNAILVRNQSVSEIDVIRIRDEFSTYGPNELGGPLFPGQSLEIFGLDCGVYDVLFEDQFGTVCEVLGIDICLGEEGVFTITEGLLDSCAFGVKGDKSDDAAKPKEASPPTVEGKV